MAWVGKDLEDHMVPTPPPCAGTPLTRPGHPKPHPVNTSRHGASTASLGISKVVKVQKEHGETSTIDITSYILHSKVTKTSDCVKVLIRWYLWWCTLKGVIYG